MRLLGVMVQKQARLAAYRQRHPHPFPLLADEARRVVRSYGVYVALNFESFRIARPATFLIDPGGLIRFIHVGRHQFDRPSVEQIMAILDGPGRRSA